MKSMASRADGHGRGHDGGAQWDGGHGRREGCGAQRAGYEGGCGVGELRLCDTPY